MPSHGGRGPARLGWSPEVLPRHPVRVPPNITPPPHSGTCPLATFAGKLLRGDFIYLYIFCTFLLKT